MKSLGTFVAVTALTHSVAGAGVVPSADGVTVSTQPQDQQHQQHSGRSPFSSFAGLRKRKGGGGKGGGRGGRGGSGSSSGRGSSSSNEGGSTKTGSGPKPAYGSGGNYYGGGARVPYTSGTTSPGGIAPILIAGAVVGVLSAEWMAGAYCYPYAHPYTFQNVTTNNEETKPVECLCTIDQECGCDDNSDDKEYMSSILGDGSYEGLNKTLVDVATINGTTTIVINGTLPNGTTASGGTEDAFSAADGVRGLIPAMGWWLIATTALAFARLV